MTRPTTAGAAEDAQLPARATLSTACLGSWSGGRFMHFGERLDERRLQALLTPDDALRTVVTADVYGQGAADELVGRAIAGRERMLVGAVGHDFYTGRRDGAKGYPRLTDPRLRGPSEYAAYLRMATERSLARCGAERFDLLLLHNPDRTGYSHPAVWEGMAALRDAGLAAAIGVAPGPANGFTLDLLACIERYGALLDWAMIILNPFEPWPGELVLDAAAAAGVSVLTRVVDYGGLFWDDVLPGHPFPEWDHRLFRPAGWIEQGRAKLDRIRPIAERHGLTPMQLACQWNLAHPAVRSVVPTLLQEPGGRPIEDKRAELAALPADVLLSDDEVAEIRAVGDNTGCMALKGASPEHDGDERPDRWPLSDELLAVGRRHGIEPARDLVQSAA